MMTETSGLVGQSLGQGRYQVKRKLGEGGMAIVYLAHDKNVGVDVVIKIPKPIILADPEFARRFKHEIRSMVQLAHPHIVKVKDVGEHQGVPYYVMESLAGGSLADRLHAYAGKKTTMGVKSLANWLPTVAAALDFTHAQGIVHRDIKPGNILFDSHGNAFISDFGIAKAISGPKEMKRQTVLTQAGVVLGTGPYLAPEVSLGEAYDGRADQYALAATIYEALSGRPPFEGTSFHAIILKQTSGEIAPLHTLVPKVPKSLSQVIHKGLNQDPKKRFADCSALARAVQGAVGDVSSTAFQAVPPATPTLKANCPSCRKPFALPGNPEGKNVTCPACGTAFRVAKRPAEPEAAETTRSSPIATPTRMTPARAAGQPGAGKASKMPWYLVGGVVGGLLLMSCVGLVFFLGIGLFAYFRQGGPAKADQPQPLAQVDPQLQQPKPAAPPVIQDPVQKNPAPIQPVPKNPAPPIDNPKPPANNPPPLGEQMLAELGMGRFLFESMVNVTDLAAKAKNVKSYGYVDNVSIMSAWLNTGNSVSFNQPLTANTGYLFLAAGDNDAQIIDLEVYDLAGKKVVWDVSNNRNGIVEYTPAFTGVRQLRVSLRQSRENVECFCSLVILRRNGWTIDFKNLDDATYTLAKRAADWNKLPGGKKYEFRKAANQWAVFGGALNPGNALDITGYTMGFGDRVFFGSCDKLSNRLDLNLLQNGKLVSSSTGANNAPSILQKNCAGGGYQLQMRNNSTLPGASVVMMGVLDVK